MPPTFFSHAQQQAQGRAEYWVQLTAVLAAGGANPVQQGPFVANLALPNDFHVYGLNYSSTSDLFQFKWGEQAAQWFWMSGFVDARAAFTTYARTIFDKGGEIVIPAGVTGIESYFLENSGAQNTVNLLFFGYLTP